MLTARRSPSDEPDIFHHFLSLVCSRPMLMLMTELRSNQLLMVVGERTKSGSSRMSRESGATYIGKLWPFCQLNAGQEDEEERAE